MFLQSLNQARLPIRVHFSVKCAFFEVFVSYSALKWVVEKIIVLKVSNQGFVINNEFR